MTTIKTSDELRNFIDYWCSETLEEALTQANERVDDMEYDIIRMKEIRSEIEGLIDVHGEDFEFGDADEDE